MVSNVEGSKFFSIAVWFLIFLKLFDFGVAGI
jgi:hypothetical protein